MKHVVSEELGHSSNEADSVVIAQYLQLLLTRRRFMAQLKASLLMKRTFGQKFGHQSIFTTVITKGDDSGPRKTNNGILCLSLYQV